jgi:hypothetical protein
MSVESVARSLLMVLAALVAVAGPGAALVPDPGLAGQGNLWTGVEDALLEPDLCGFPMYYPCQAASTGPCQLADISLSRPPHAILILDPDACLWNLIKQALPPSGLIVFPHQERGSSDSPAQSPDEPDA